MQARPARRPLHSGTVDDVLLPQLKPTGVIHPEAVKHPSVDCFYVYPTVSGQKTTLANFKVDPVERSIAHQQVIGLVKKEAAVFTAKG